MKIMDLDKNLMRLQGALNSFSVNTPDNQKLQLLSALFQNVDETAKTKMVFFLILNTKMRTTNLLLNDATVNIVSSNTQNLDFPALSYIIFNLNLVGNLSEIVSNSPAALTVEVLTGVFAYADSRIQIRGLQKVIIGLFEKIIKISKGIHKEFSHMYNFWEFMNIFGDMMWCSSAFQNEELLEEDMNNILETCLICVNLYQESKPLSYNQTYELKVLRDKLNSDELISVPPGECKNRFTKYICKLLDLFNDIFNSWLKYDPVENLTALCENAFALYEKLENSDIEPNNLSYLDEIKKKPETELEKMVKTDINTMIERVSTTPIPEKWLRGLIYNPHLTTNEDAMLCLKAYIDCVDPQDLVTAAAVIQEHFKKYPVSSMLTDLYLTCLGKMLFPDLIVEFENFIALDQKPDLEGHTFDDELREFFNKMLTRDLYVKSRIVIFCIRSPIKTIKKICEHAILNAEQLSCCALDLMMLKSACLLKNPASEEGQGIDIIRSVLYPMIDNEGYGSTERSRLIGLIQRLQKKDALDLNIEKFIFAKIHREYSRAKYDELEFALEILRSFIRANRVRSDRVVVFAFLSQLLSRTLWSCSTFTTKLAKIREIIITNIHTMMRDWISSAKEKGLLWLRNDVIKTGDINQIHFCELWHSFGSEMAISKELHIQLFVLVHATSKIDSMIEFIVRSFRFQRLLTLRISFTAAFIQILPILTCRAWTILMTHVKTIIISWLDFQTEKPNIDVNLFVFRIFSLSLYSLAQDMNQNQDMKLCFSYCLRNFGRMAQENILIDSDMRYEVALGYVEELLFLLNGIQDPRFRKESSILLSPIVFGFANIAKNTASAEGAKIFDLEDWYKKNFIGEVGNEPFVGALYD